MSQICDQLHQIVEGLPIFSFPFDTIMIPNNGIYMMFETGEYGHGANRIVRVGSHTGIDKLRSRLNEHFINENKDRSIFRKNIGRAILNRDKDPFLTQWELDLTSKEAREKYGNIVDLGRQNQVEKQVTDHIRKNFRFVAIRVDEQEKRKQLESKIISTISLCSECYPSVNWLGKYSPKEKIQQGGLWNVNELFKTPLSKNEFEFLEKQI